MHLQQTKRGSRESGGPQYYFHDLSEHVKTYLRNKDAIKVALVTPYGATKTDFYAVGKDHKIDISNLHENIDVIELDAMRSYLT